MDSPISADGHREQAVALRRTGKSRREIKEILGISSNEALGKLLAGAPQPGE
jgi:DNA-binding CsgD family transcriptional regulator